MTIEKLIINNQEKNLTVAFNRGKTFTLSFEYLRVFTSAKKVIKGQPELICHKKAVLINAIEPVGKHGFRLLFDDEHNAIFSEEYLKELAINNDSYWQQYLSQLQQSGHSREAMINITQL